MALTRSLFGQGFFGSVSRWVSGLLLLLLCYQAFAALLSRGAWQPSFLVVETPGWLGLLLPFCAFAGGLAYGTQESARPLAVRASVIGLLAYVLLAYVVPLAVFQEGSMSGADLQSVHPFGPDTPGALVAQRRAIVANPPERFSFRVSEPLTHPPNWLTYGLHSPIVLSVFAIFAAFLGRKGRTLTTGLSPPNRKNSRWALGLFVSLAFFLAVAAGAEWVRKSPSNSGVLGAWLPLIVPLAGLGVLELLIRRRAGPLSTPAQSNDESRGNG